MGLVDWHLLKPHWVSPIIDHVTLPAHAVTSGFQVTVEVNDAPADAGTDNISLTDTLPASFNAGDFTIPFGDDGDGNTPRVRDVVMNAMALVNPGEDVSLNITHSGAGSNFDFARRYSVERNGDCGWQWHCCICST